MNFSLILVRLFFFPVLLLFLLLTSPFGVLASTEEAIFAGGCFWCLEHDLEGLPGVISAQSGYTGGDLSDPTYKEHKGHQESVLIRFDTSIISYKKLLRSFWRNIDPFDGKGQFCDRGDSYKPVIFIEGSQQEMEAFKSVGSASKELGKPIAEIKVQIKSAQKFWLAEEYHQDFADRNKIKYNFYRYSCGRDIRLDESWGETARTNKEWRTKGQI